MPVRLSPRATSATRGDGVGQARIAIEQIVPAVDGGAFPVKCGVHDAVQVEADIFMDGHDRLAAELRWRADDEPAWRAVPLVPVGNDRWSASFRPDRIGPHAFQVAAWHDGWETFRHELEVKHAAGASLRLEREEGLQLLLAADQRASQAATPGAGLIKRALRACAAPAPDIDP
ncbi:maltotransferase domain-containing protein, partial [Achromobacter ruhlandii]|uniref:maltotransferase domain-containing protein n=1 Tax=Achromobacter ruhlandii TaxID=72557 RepID=UPI0032119724